MLPKERSGRSNGRDVIDIMYWFSDNDRFGVRV
jgi:hypothetical protein